MAGTDANITFTLTGTLGMARKTLDTEPMNRMPSGWWNHLTIPRTEGSVSSGRRR
jgi:hypothetical protein